jgi:hypothetical protein
MKKSDIYNRIQKYCISHFQKLNPEDFVMGEIPLNSKCHLNAVQKVKEGKAVKVFSCYTFDRSNNSQCIHFINQLADGKYQDNTWGWMNQWSDYYIIKEITSEEQEHIWDSLVDTRNSIVNMCSTKFERFVLRLKPLNCI